MLEVPVLETAVVGIAQWLPAPGRPAANLETATGLVTELARRGADLVVLPELWPCGYDVATLRRDATAAAEPLAGPRVAALATCARDLGIWLAAGSVPEAVPEAAVYNTALLFDRQGRLRAWHRKTHLYAPTGEDRIFAAGDRITTCRTGELGVVGLTVCFDGDFPETGRALRDAGATLVIQPSAYESAAATWWDVLYRAVALSNGQWWVLANQCGAGMLGRSQVISPFGEVVAVAGVEAELMVTEVPLRRSWQMAAHANAALWQLRRSGLTVHEFGAEEADELAGISQGEG